MNYSIKELNKSNAEDYARVNALAWKQSYKGIINQDFLDLINQEDEIKKSIEKLKNNLSQKDNQGFILYVDNKPVGMLRVGSSREEKYSECGELRAIYLLEECKGKGFGKILYNKAFEELKKMGYKNVIIACLEENPSNDFYKHMGGKLVDTNIFKLPNQELKENVYYLENI